MSSMDLAVPNGINGHLLCCRGLNMQHIALSKYQSDNYAQFHFFLMTALIPCMESVSNTQCIEASFRVELGDLLSQ